MKVLSLLILLLLTSCVVNTNEKTPEQLEFERIAQRRFDIGLFDKNKEKRYKKMPSSDTHIYVYIDSAKVHHELIYSQDAYYEKITYPDSLICDNYGFYLSGHIKGYGRGLIKGYVGIGKSVYFDEKGNITEIVDHEEHFPFGFEQLLAFIKENDIDIWDEKVRIVRGMGGKGDYLPGIHTWGLEIKIIPEYDLNEYIRKRIPLPERQKRIIELDGIAGDVLLDTIVEDRSYEH